MEWLIQSIVSTKLKSWRTVLLILPDPFDIVKGLKIENWYDHVLRNYMVHCSIFYNFAFSIIDSWYCLEYLLHSGY